MTFPACQGQGDVVLAAGGNVDLCTLLQEQLRHSQMALSGGEGGREREGGRGGGRERSREGGRERSREGGREREMTTCIYVTTYIHVYKKEDLMNCMLDGVCPKEFQYGTEVPTHALYREKGDQEEGMPHLSRKRGQDTTHLRLK